MKEKQQFRRINDVTNKTMEDQIQPHELCAYLPYKVSVLTEFGEMEMTHVNTISKYTIWACSEWNSETKSYIPNINRVDNSIGRGFKINEVKLLLYPIEDLITEREYGNDYFIPLRRLENFAVNYGVNKGVFERVMNDVLDGKAYITELPYYLMSKLYEWHFDTFDLIGRGMAERKIN